MAKKTTKRMPKRREEYTYHGYNLEALQAMSMEELLPLMPSGARRKVLRGFTAGEEDVRAKIAAGDGVRTHIRSMIILPEMVGKKVVLLANLAPRKIRGVESHGMLLCAANADDSKLSLLTVDSDMEDGCEIG